MNRPLPILHVPTIESQRAMLTALHPLGYRWASTLKNSLDSLSDTVNSQQYIYIMKNGAIWWMDKALTDDLLKRRGTTQWTLVNSLSHLISYLKAGKPNV